VQITPLVRFFGKKKGGLPGRKFFVKVFLSKKHFRRFEPEKRAKHFEKIVEGFLEKMILN
jgi:hypothetical protein